MAGLEPATYHARGSAQSESLLMGGRVKPGRDNTGQPYASAA